MKKFGFSFSLKRALGISAAKNKISRKIGIPLTKGGRQRKLGRMMGCCVFLIVNLTSMLLLYTVLSIFYLSLFQLK